MPRHRRSVRARRCSRADGHGLLALPRGAHFGSAPCGPQVCQGKSYRSQQRGIGAASPRFRESLRPRGGTHRNRRSILPPGGVALAPLSAKAESQGSDDFSALHAGQGAALGRELPVGELTLRLAAEALERLTALARA